MEGSSFIWGLAAISTAAAITWSVSLIKNDVSIVDSLWSLLFLLAALTYGVTALELGPRAGLALALVTVWALRLSVFITWRNWDEPEDRRYQEIRRNNQPRFELKSLYLVFGLQGLLAWIISLPLLIAVTGTSPLNLLDYLGVSLWLLGMAFEAGGDFQLARFKADPANRGRVMDQGLWRYTRHPNYFGDCCVWWGFYLIALAAGGWWTILAPALMTVLLLRVSGVALLEKNIAERRPAYHDYISRTNAFIPGPARPLSPLKTEVN